MCTEFTRMASAVRKIIKTSQAPRPVGPYNQAVQVGNMLYLSGALGLDKDTNKLVSGDIVDETRQVFTNMGKILEAGGSCFENVIKVTVLLSDINDFGAVNDLYKEYFKEFHPARTTFQVGKLPLGARLEIDLIAVVGDLTTSVVEC